MTFSDKCQHITVILSDVDGVMTDGGLMFDDQGHELKKFHVRDGMGIRLWREAGYTFGIITARQSEIVARRAKEIKVEIVRQGHHDKLAQVLVIASELGVDLENICYIGDDLHDLAAIQSVGLGASVSDAAVEVRDAADFVTSAPGGDGAIRELTEMILRTTGHLGKVLQPYFAASEK